MNTFRAGVIGRYLRVEVERAGAMLVLLEDGDRGVIAGGFDCESEQCSSTMNCGGGDWAQDRSALDEMPWRWSHQLDSWCDMCVDVLTPL